MNQLEEARTILSKASTVIITAGAGMSAEIGAKTYWSGDDKQYAGDISPYGLTDLEHAHGATWDTHRKSQIAFYQDSLASLLSMDILGANSPYRILKDYLETTGKDYFIQTSNVDSAFSRAGYDRTRIHEIHGTRFRSQCLTNPQEHGVFKTDTSSITICPACDGDTRPNCLFFVDFEFNPSVTGKQQDAFAEFRTSIDNASTVLLEIGAGTTIAAIRNLSLRLNSKNHIPIIRINPHEINNDGGLKNILPKSPTAPFFRVETSATEGLRLLTQL
jgi:NAD-dependent SIR2 family protein deacetylase